MKIRNHAWLLGMLFSFPAFGAKLPIPELETVLVRNVEGDLEIDQAGRVEHFIVDKSVPPEIATQLTKAVHGWRFEPVMVGGKPANARTRMRVTLRAEEPTKNRFVVYVDNLSFLTSAAAGATAADEPKGTAQITIRHRRPAARYPAALAANGVSGGVVVQVRLTPDGKVAGAHVAQSALFDVKAKPDVAAQALALFENAALSVVKKWTFGIELNGADPTEPRGGFLAFAFRMEDVPATTALKWRRLTRTPLRPAPWATAEAGDMPMGVADVVDGSNMLPETSPFKLASDVRGQAL